MKPTVFIGSTSERQGVARAIELNISEHAKVNIWIHSFSPSRTVYQELLDFSSRYDFAVIVMSSDDIVISRGVEAPAPRDNVIFELGLFLGAIGIDRVFAVTESKKKSRIMSDFLGVSYLSYDGERSDGDLTKALSPASTRIIESINKHGPRDAGGRVKNFLFPGEMIGLEKIYDNFDSARNDIYEDLRRTTGSIRIFVHIASQDIGLKGSFFDVLDEIAINGSVDIRVLHANRESRLFSKDRLRSMGKDYQRVQRSLDYATASLRSLEKAENSSLRRRSHSFPFIWRLYFVSDRVYFMPYFNNKDAIKNSPVLVFSRLEKSMYNVLKEWFDYVWEISSPEHVTVSDLISPATPSGSALFLIWEGKHVFGIPKRDVVSNLGRVRFYGIGGKRQSAAESFEDCAVREGKEELSNAVGNLSSARTTKYMRSDGTMREISVSGFHVTPRLILEKVDHTGRGIMAVNADDYMLVAFDGVLEHEPRPSSELAALVLLSDAVLSKFIEESEVRVEDIIRFGGEIIYQDHAPFPNDTILIPHGTASFLIRSLIK